MHEKFTMIAGFISSSVFVAIPFGTAVMVFAGQLFLRLISSKLLSAHTRKTRMRLDIDRHVA